MLRRLFTQSKECLIPEHIFPPSPWHSHPSPCTSDLPKPAHGGLSKVSLFNSAPPSTAEGEGFTSEHSSALGSDIPLCCHTFSKSWICCLFGWHGNHVRKIQTSSCFFPSSAGLSSGGMRMWDRRRISSRYLKDFFKKLVLVIEIKHKHNVLLIAVSKWAFVTWF